VGIYPLDKKQQHKPAEHKKYARCKADIGNKVSLRKIQGVKLKRRRKISEEKDETV
jgi:hypothetical protein